jgi:hypothetical protein
MTQHYCRRKNGEEEVKRIHPEIDKILEKTYGVMAYQEQAMFLSVALAGFTEVDADMLRKCVTGDTMFCSSQRGWISINTLIKTGYKYDHFLVMDGAGCTGWKKIDRIWSTGKHDVRAVRTRSGFTVRATKHHQFLTDTGWKARMRLRPEEDYLVSTREIEFVGEDKIPLHECMVIAGIVTEGHFVEEHSATFVNHDKFMMETFQSNYQTMFGYLPRMTPDGKVARLLKSDKQKLATKLEYGLSGAKRLPEAMLGATKPTMKAFLSFMLAAECGVTESSGQLEFASKSSELVRQVKLMLLRFKIRSTILETHVDGYPDSYWKLYINNAVDQRRVLSELTEYWPEYKRQSLRIVVDNKETENFTTDVVPTTIVTRMLNQYPFVGNYESGTVFTASLSRPRFDRMAIKTNDTEWKTLATGKQQYDLLVSTEEMSKQCETFDFTVGGGDTPYIVADGLVIHNSIGKKLPEEMAKCKKMFIDGAAKKKVITPELAKEVFDWIEKSQRYQFNGAHSIAYGLIGYDTAYIKAHFPLAFFTAWLYYAKDKQDPQQEINELVSDAKLFDITVEPPDFRTLEPHFHTDRKTIKFGLSDIKGIGINQVTKIKNNVTEAEAKLSRKVHSWTWYEFLLNLSRQLPSHVVTKLIECGALRWMGRGRQEMLAEFRAFESLTDKEATWIADHPEFNNIIDALTGLGAPRAKPKSAKKTMYDEPVVPGGCANENRRQTVLSHAQVLRNPPTKLVDTPHWVAWVEEQHLGISLTCNIIDSCDTSSVNVSCKDYLSGRAGYLVFGVEVQNVREVITKKGKTPGSKMAFLTIADASCALQDVVCFPDVWKECHSLLRPRSTVILHGERDQRKDSQTLIVKNVWEALPA